MNVSHAHLVTEASVAFGWTPHGAEAESNLWANDPDCIIALPDFRTIPFR